MRAAGGRLAAVMALAPAMSAFAHHAGVYDETRISEIRGTVTAMAWQNPHVVLELRDAESGSVWRLEGTSQNVLGRWGIVPERIPIGSVVSARGPVAFADDHAMVAAVLRLDSGEQLVLWPTVAARLGLASSGVEGAFPPPTPTSEAAAAARSDIFRVWTPRGHPQAAAPRELLTAEARARAAAYDPLTDDPALRCVAPGMPGILDTPYPVEFVDRGDRIVMRLEEWDAEREIYLRPGGGPPIQDPSPLGVSFGRWEGTTLAVFTTYIDYPYADRLGTPQGEAVTVLERYVPNADFTRLDWTITVTEASTFADPWIRRGYFAWEPGESVEPYSCALTAPRAAVPAAP